MLLVPLTSLAVMTLMTPGMLLGFGDVDADDVRVMDFGKDDGQVRDALGHLQGHIVAVVGETGDLGEGGRPRVPRPVDLLLALEVVGDVVHGGFAAHDLGCRHHRVHQGLVSGAAADVVVLLEPGADLFARGRGVLGKRP